MARKLDAVLFDLSYTLLTNGRSEAFHAALDRAGGGLDLGSVHELLSQADREFARRFPERAGDPVYGWIDDYTEILAAIVERHAGWEPGAAREMLAPAARAWAAGGHAWRPYPDVVPALRELRALGVRLAAVSNWGASGRAVLQACGLLDLFDAVVLSSEVGVQKPHPRIFEHALGLLGASAEGAVMVGDDYVNDVAGAAGIGMRGILLDRFGLADRDAPPCAVARTMRGVVMAAADPEAHLPSAVPRARGGGPVAARPSASVVLLRDGPRGVEVLMGIRAPEGTMPDVAAFPGGSVQPGDLDGPTAPGSLLERAGGHRPHAGRGPSEGALWLRPSDVPDVAFRRAAVRETFEETGIWLGGAPRPGEAERERLLAGDVPGALAGLAPERLAGLVELGWLEAPPHLAVRFFTRFYAAPMPPGETPRPHTREFVRLEWWRPEDALNTGGPPLLLPTRAVLRRLTGFASAGALLAEARRAARPWLTPRAPMPYLP
ncbi:MAG: HAD-IA family hydrolase [Clostridia bacterium]|nr:HAD-IA family hydrolase [Clostridia bacterium]